MAVDMKELKALVSHLEGLREKRLVQQLEIGKLILPSRGLFKGEETESLRDANLLNPAAQRALRNSIRASMLSTKSCWGSDALCFTANHPREPWRISPVRPAAPMPWRWMQTGCCRASCVV